MSSPILRFFMVLALPLGAWLLIACTTPPAAETASAALSSAPAAITEPAPESVPVIRRGRYTLVELTPESAQRDLLGQVVEVTIPPGPETTVGTALRHVLRHSGYRLCDTDDTAALFALPLPAAHLRLGPLPLREALATLAGPAWALSADDISRQVCFTRSAVPANLPPLPERETPP